MLSHSIIPLHINGTNTISLPLLLFIIHAVGAHRNPSHGALILFVLAEQIHPKRQVTVLKKHFIFSLNRQDSQRVGEEITRDGLPTATPPTTDLQGTSSKELWSPGKVPWSMAMLREWHCPACSQSFDSISLSQAEPFPGTHTPPHTSKALALEPCRAGQGSGAPRACAGTAVHQQHKLTLRDAQFLQLSCMSHRNHGDPSWGFQLLLKVCLNSAKSAFIHACLSGIRSNYCLWGLNEEVCSD